MTHGDRRRQSEAEGPSAGAVARIGIDNPGPFGEDRPLTASVIMEDLTNTLAGFPPETVWTLTYASPTRIEFEAFPA
ncbi:hypothetical protein SEA_FUZZBUSTER_50 [Microbacterium phage FuzzBuster]|uniref:Uncharacterized protein n=1 Tax=Microbacterium phage FuzzBuster TaxID=2590935 RepID=A0A516KV23_9CAUD|nr:hypothetical protein SEA_FUZZBUSTER_50 [Microbacterium phage FuzzBuster]